MYFVVDDQKCPNLVKQEPVAQEEIKQILRATTGSDHSTHERVPHSTSARDGGIFIFLISLDHLVVKGPPLVFPIVFCPSILFNMFSYFTGLN